MGLKRTIKSWLPTSTNRIRRAASWLALGELGGDGIARIEATPGCLDTEQGSILFYLAARGGRLGAVVEIGSFLGLSTLWLAHGVRRSSGSRIIAIDPHTGHERPELCPELDSFGTFLDNIHRAGMDDIVEPVRRPSQDIARDWSEPIGLLWIDGSHDYADVSADLEGFAPRVSSGGYVALHDTRSKRFPGVRQAMLEYFAKHREFTRLVELRNMTVYERSR